MGDLRRGLRLGIVCGMVAEARALGRWAGAPGVEVAVSGADPVRAEALALDMVQAGARHLLSWGIAGGLDPVLAPGTLVLPAELIEPGGVPMALATPGGAGRVLGSDRLIRDPGEKARLWAETGAVAVDMESHRLVRASGGPVSVVRAISDPAGRALPALAATALGPDGRPRMRRVLAGVLTRPQDVPGLLWAGRDSRAALAALRDAADRILPVLLERVGP